MNIIVEYGEMVCYDSGCLRFWSPARLTGKWKLEEKIEDGDRTIIMYLEIMRQKYRTFRKPIEVQHWAPEDAIRYRVEHSVNNCGQ